MIPISDSVRTGKFPFLNSAIIVITIIVFFLQITSPDPEAFIYVYALVPALIDVNNFQTLTPFVTAMFLHGDLLHLGSNMLFLWVFGDNIEEHVGGFFYLFIYFASGILGNVAQYVFTPDSSVPMLGASGAVAGVLGAYFVILPHSKIKTIVPFFGFASIVEVPAPIMLGYWFVLQIISGAASIPLLADATGGVAFFAHIGGFAVGFLLAKIMHPRVKP